MQLGLPAWHRFMLANDSAMLADLLAPDVVLHCAAMPVSHRGASAVAAYLAARGAVLDPFAYVRELTDGAECCLEFEAGIDGLPATGVDLIRFDVAGRIADIAMLLRPQAALDRFGQVMAVRLENT